MGVGNLIILDVLVWLVKVTKVARMLSAKPVGFEYMERTCTVMALLDGGMLKRHKSWLKVFCQLIIVNSISSCYASIFLLIYF